MENHFIFVRKSISLSLSLSLFLSLSLSLSLEMIFIEWHSNCIETLFWCPNNNNSYDAPIYQKKLSTLSLFASLHLTLQHSNSQSITIYLTSMKICHSRCNLHTIEFYAPWQFVPLFLLNWANPGLFFIYFRSFQTNIKTILQQINVKNVNSIQHMVPGFEPTSSRSWVTSHNH